MLYKYKFKWRCVFVLDRRIAESPCLYTAIYHDLGMAVGDKGRQAFCSTVLTVFALPHWKLQSLYGWLVVFLTTIVYKTVPISNGSLGHKGKQNCFFKSDKMVSQTTIDLYLCALQQKLKENKRFYLFFSITYFNRH